MQFSKLVLFAAIAPLNVLIARQQTCDMNAFQNEDQKAGWQLVSTPQDSAILEGSASNELLESGGSPLDFPKAGNYWVWIQYRSEGEGRASSFYAVVRDDNTEVIAFEKFDWLPVLPTQRPWQSQAEDTSRGANQWRWKSVHVVAEREMKGHLHFGALRGGGTPTPRKIREVIITDNQDFTPSKNVSKAMKSRSPSSALMEAGTSHDYLPAVGFPLDTGFFAGDKEPEKQFKMGLSYNARVLRDDAKFVKLGFNRTHNVTPAPLFGIRQMRPMDVYHQMDSKAGAQFTPPEGRFVNSKGEVGSLWSLTFPPLQDGVKQRTREAVSRVKDDSTVESLRIVAEVGGLLDYSPSSQTAFRKWLRKRHSTIEGLNSLWKTQYNSFEEIIPPKDPEHKASWFDFREFSGHVFALAIKAQADAIREEAPRFQRLQQLSNLDLLSPKFTTMRPMDWEEFIAVALENEEFISWDAYSVDDYMGAEIELVRSLSEGRTLLNEEWNNHAPDPRIAGRTLWTMVGKGLRGVHCFQWQEGLFHDSYPKWALLNQDFTPKLKLGAIADAAHEIHRFERLIMAAKPVDTVKPVAIYYSRLDLSLAKPLMSAWGEPVDTPYHVFSTLRGMGYPVRWITPKQIESGALKDVAAVILIDAQHIPKNASLRLANWVKQGGALIGDRWPGAFDEYGRPQELLSEVFGIRTKQARETSGGQLALEESTQGYGEVTVSAITGEEISNTVAEIWQQWDSTHPIARDLGPFTLSGFGRTAIQCTAGSVVGMTFGGDPGIVVNDYGKGKAMYVSMMLGSIYEGAATRYEWDSTHSGLAFPRLLASFLRYAGVPTFSDTDLPTRLQTKLRVERWLSDEDKNSLLMLTSMNDVPLPAFGLTVQWPEGTPGLGMLLFSKNGSRELSPLAFEVKGEQLKISLPSFDTHATILALNNSQPLVGLHCMGKPRSDAGLLKVSADEEFEVEATIYNPSKEPLPAGEIQIWAPKGWWLSATKAAIQPIAPFSTIKTTFRIKSASLVSALDLQPITVKYSAGDVISTPATELVWWTP